MILEWPGQSRDLNLYEMSVSASIKAERTSIPPHRCERLIVSYHRHLIAVLAAKRGTTSC